MSGANRFSMSIGPPCSAMDSKKEGAAIEPMIQVGAPHALDKSLFAEDVLRRRVCCLSDRSSVVSVSTILQASGNECLRHALAAETNDSSSDKTAFAVHLTVCRFLNSIRIVSAAVLPMFSGR